MTIEKQNGVAEADLTVPVVVHVPRHLIDLYQEYMAKLGRHDAEAGDEQALAWAAAVAASQKIAEPFLVLQLAHLIAGGSSGFSEDREAAA